MASFFTRLWDLGDCAATLRAELTGRFNASSGDSCQASFDAEKRRHEAARRALEKERLENDGNLKQALIRSPGGRGSCQEEAVEQRCDDSTKRSSPIWRR